MNPLKHSVVLIVHHIRDRLHHPTDAEFRKGAYLGASPESVKEIRARWCREKEVRRLDSSVDKLDYLWAPRDSLALTPPARTPGCREGSAHLAGSE